MIEYETRWKYFAYPMCAVWIISSFFNYHYTISKGDSSTSAIHDSISIFPAYSAIAILLWITYTIFIVPFIIIYSEWTSN